MGRWGITDMFIMKKFLLVLVAVVGFGLCSNAQMCKTTGNVEWNVTGSSDATVTFTNNNSYQVTVSATITIVNSLGEEKSYDRTFVIKANDSKSYDKLNPKSGTVAADDCKVTMTVSKCD